MTDWQVITGDCIDAMAEMEPESVDSIVTDPPYGLGFMGKHWDRGVPGVKFWRRAFDVLKPGGHLAAFGGTRTHHRLWCAIEDAGFEVRDTLSWMYGSGFPKSLDVGKAIDKAAGVEREIIGDSGTGRKSQNGRDGSHTMRVWGNDEGAAPITAPATDAAREWDGWGTALKPAHEPICLARKPFTGTVAANVQEHGTGAINVDGCRVGTDEDTRRNARGGDNGLCNSDTFKIRDRRAVDQPPRSGRWPANVCLDEQVYPVLRLKDTVDPVIHETIAGYYDRYELPELWDRVSNVSKQGQVGQGEILQPGVLRKSIEQDSRGKAPTLWNSPHARVAEEDANREEGSGQKRAGQPQLQGVLDEPGIQIYQRGCAVAWTGRDCGTDGVGWPPGNSRAPVGDGDAPGSTVGEGRGCAPPERGQRRQPDRELGVGGPRNTQAGSPGDCSRASATTCGKREVEILDCDVPNNWLNYFEPAGYSLRSPCGAAAMLDEQSGERSGGSFPARRGEQNIYGGGKGLPREVGTPAHDLGDTGGASRFFYCAKASRAERTCNGKVKCDHPTVKPVALMRWLVRLITPPSGVVLDPFAGSGSTGVAAAEEGFEFIGIELDPAYADIARARIGDATRQQRLDLGPAPTSEQERLW